MNDTSLGNWWQEQKEERMRERQEKRSALLTYLPEKHPQVQRIEVEYSGSGDEGYVDEIRYYDANDQPLEVEDADLGEILDDLCWLATPEGFYNDDGGQGTVSIYPTTGKILVEHGQNYMKTVNEEYEVKDGEPLPSRFE